jgi:Resolvase, N terminal domain
MRAVLYLRVSTIEQTTENQERELREAAGRKGWNVVKVYEDRGIRAPRVAMAGRHSMPCARLPCVASRRGDGLVG